jgi:hypothetical protein
MNYDPKKELEVLRRIRPNTVYSAQTRKNIISHANRFERPASPSFFFMHRLSITASAFALILLVAGSYAGFQQYSGTRWSALNPAALRAEADAVETQVKVAEVKYQEAAAAKKPPLKMAAPKAAALSATAPDSTSTQDASGTLTVDEALDILTQ